MGVIKVIKKKIPSSWLLPSDWVEQVYQAVGKKFPVEVIDGKFVIIDNSELQQEDIQTIKTTVEAIREEISDINV